MAIGLRLESSIFTMCGAAISMYSPAANVLPKFSHRLPQRSSRILRANFSVSQLVQTAHSPRDRLEVGICPYFAAHLGGGKTVVLNVFHFFRKYLFRRFFEIGTSFLKKSFPLAPVHFPNKRRQPRNHLLSQIKKLVSVLRKGDFGPDLAANKGA